MPGLRKFYNKYLNISEADKKFGDEYAEGRSNAYGQLVLGLIFIESETLVREGVDGCA